MKTTKTVVIATLALGLSLPACARQDPCLSLAPPTAAELAAAASGSDIEREVGDDECDLENGRWVWDRDDAYGTSSNNHRTTVKASPRATTKTTKR